jgi:hypothetical protein
MHGVLLLCTSDLDKEECMVLTGFEEARRKDTMNGMSKRHWTQWVE